MTAKSRSVNPKVLDSFWHLVEEDVDVRCNAALTILKELKACEKNYGQLETGGDLHYTVTRLVRGLASDRKFARRGYASVLCEIIQHFPHITAGDILKIASSSLKANEKNLSKKEVSNVLLGRVLLYLTFCETGLLKKASEQDVKAVTKGLLECAKLKPPLQALCASSLGQLIATVGADQFDEAVMPVLGESLRSGWEAATADSLYLLTAAAQYHPETIGKDFLAANWKCKKVMHKDNLPHLVSVLSRCSSPRHPLVQQLVQLATKEDDKHFTRFWREVVTDGLMKLKKKPVCLEMTKLGLRVADSPAKVQAILNEAMTDFIAKHCFQKVNTFQKDAWHIMETLPEVVHQYITGEQQVAVIRAFLGLQHGLKFCENKLIENTIMKMSAGGGQQLATLLKDYLEGYTLLSSHTEGAGEGGQPVLAESDQRSALQLLGVLVRQQYAAGGIQPAVDLTQWLFLHSFFMVETTNTKITHCHRKPKHKIPHNLADDVLFRSLSRLTTFNPGVPVKVHHEQNIEVLYQLVQYADVLLSDKDTVSVLSPLKEQSQAAWKVMLADVEKMRSKHGKVGELGQGHAFQLLLLYLALQLFKDQKAAVEALQDIHVCCEKAFEKRRKSAKLDQDEPGWMEVTVELLLSLLSRPSAIVRAVANTVFTLLCPNMTTAALQLVLSALSAGSAEEDPLEFEDDDASSSEETEDAEAGSHGNTNGTNHKAGAGDAEDASSSSAEDDEDDDDDDDSDVDDDEAPVDNQLRQSVKKALGNAVARSDDEGSNSESELDDEAMSKLDGALAAAFRSMRTSSREGQKKQEQQVKDFKQRVMSLLEIFVRSDAPPQVVLELLSPLLDFMDSAARDQNNRALTNKANQVFRQLCNKKFGSNPSFSKAELPSMVGDLIERSKKVSGCGLVIDVATAISFLIRITQGQQKKIVPSSIKSRSEAAKATSSAEGNSDQVILNEIVSKIAGAIQDYSERKQPLLNHLLFHTILQKHPVLLWNVSDILLGYISSEDIKVYCKTQLCSMLMAMLKKDIPHSVGADTWSSFLERLREVAISTVAAMAREGFRSKHAQEFLSLVNQGLRVSKESQVSFPDSFTGDLQSLKKAKEATKDVSKACNRLLGFLVSNKQSVAKKRKQDGSSGTSGAPNKKHRDQEAGNHGNEMETSEAQDGSGDTVLTDQPNISPKRKKNNQSSSHGNKFTVTQGDLGSMKPSGPKADKTNLSDISPKKKKKRRSRNHGNPGDSVSQEAEGSRLDEPAVSNTSLTTDSPNKTTDSRNKTTDSPDQTPRKKKKKHKR